MIVLFRHVTVILLAALAIRSGTATEPGTAGMKPLVQYSSASLIRCCESVRNLPLRRFESNWAVGRPIRWVRCGLCAQISQALASREPSPRITDAHLRGYYRSEPGWIAARISWLIFATEIARMASDQKPAFDVARALL
jgi:hypothetical protein